jgi:phospholipid/cholesterol/gamma-HCH transport system permease protein
MSEPADQIHDGQLQAGQVAWLRRRAPRLAGAHESLGALTGLVVVGAARSWRGRFEGGALVAQIESMGVRSLSVALLTAVFSCLVATLQSTNQMARFGAQDYVGTVVSLSQVRELGPVLTALLVGGRIGAGITAELGSMAVTEQIDAIRSMGADPVRKLVIPRVLAGMIALPLLTVAANLVGIAAAMLIAKLEAGVSFERFYAATIEAVTPGDLLGGLGKTLFFGFAISLIACHQGLRARGGTAGVGRATTRTVVVTSVVTLVSDFAFTKLFLLLGI